MWVCVRVALKQWPLCKQYRSIGNCLTTQKYACKYLNLKKKSIYSIYTPPTCNYQCIPSCMFAFLNEKLSAREIPMADVRMYNSSKSRSVSTELMVSASLLGALITMNCRWPLAQLLHKAPIGVTYCYAQRWTWARMCNAYASHWSMPVTV